MTLLKTIEIINDVAMAHPLVNSFNEGNIYDINSNTNNIYPSIILSQAPHNLGTNTNQFNFNIFYCDRLTENRDNRLLIQSNAIIVLTELINRLREIFLNINANTITTFHDRFSDELAGAYSTINIEVPNIGECFYD